MFDYVSQLPPGLLKTLLRIASSMYEFCGEFIRVMSQTPRQIILDKIVDSDTPPYLELVLDIILSHSGPFSDIYNNFSVFELLTGTTLIVVLIFGIIKFFTDIVL